MPHVTVDIKTCCSQQSSTDMYVIFIFDYISSSFFHEIFKSFLHRGPNDHLHTRGLSAKLYFRIYHFQCALFALAANQRCLVPLHMCCVRYWSSATSPTSKPRSTFVFFVDCINLKSFLRRKILAAFQTKLVSADFLSLAHLLRFHGTKPLWQCFGRGFLKAAMKMISSRCLWGERIDWEELVINNMTMKLAKSSFQKEIVQILWYPLSSSSSNQMSLCQKALQRTT